MSTIPPEMITEILYRLPVKSLLRFTCVSRRWYNQIHSPDFINLHLNHSIKTNNDRTLIIRECDVHLADFYSARFHVDDWFGKAVIIYQPLKHPNKNATIIGCSCNGLIFISKSDKEFAIWNPLIRKYKKLPVEPLEYPSGFVKCSLPLYGFGHDSVNDDYKVLRIVRFSNVGDNDCAFEFKVYSLRTHSWKRIVQEWPKEFSFHNWSMEFLNGALHCLVSLESNSYSESILAFDLESGTFCIYTTPVQPNDDRVIGLEVLEGKLCVCVNEYFTLSEVWVMEEYGIVSSWTRLYTIKQGVVDNWGFEYCKPIVFSKDGKRVLLLQNYENLIWYDMKEKQGRRVRICDMPESFVMEICVGSLVLIDGDTVIDPREEEKRNKRKRYDSASEGLNLLLEAIEGERDQEQEG